MIDKNKGFSLEAMQQTADDLSKATGLHIAIEARALAEFPYTSKYLEFHLLIDRGERSDPSLPVWASSYLSTWQELLGKVEEVKKKYYATNSRQY